MSDGYFSAVVRVRSERHGNGQSHGIRLLGWDDLHEIAEVEVCDSLYSVGSVVQALPHGEALVSFSEAQLAAVAQHDAATAEVLKSLPRL